MNFSKEDNKGAQLLNSQMHDFISRQPHWLIKYGNLIFLVVLAVACTIGLSVRYPDILQVAARISPVSLGTTESRGAGSLPGERRYTAVVSISPRQLAGLSNGKKVLLRVPSFPYQKYGSVEGTFDLNTAVLKEGVYNINVSLKKGLLTNKNFSIPCDADLYAEAIIVKSEMSVVRRIYSSVISNMDKLN